MELKLKNIYLTFQIPKIWTNSQFQGTSRPKKSKKNARESRTTEDIDQKFIAIGSAKGSVFLFDVSSGTFKELQNGRHSGKITAITWSSSAGLFTASNKEIIHWDINKESPKSKWKSKSSDNFPITAIAVDPSGDSVFTADCTIKWWKLSSEKKRKEIASFGIKHRSQITTLQCVQISSDTTFLLSGSSDDSYLWSPTQDKHNEVRCQWRFVYPSMIFTIFFCYSQWPLSLSRGSTIQFLWEKIAMANFI